MVFRRKSIPEPPPMADEPAPEPIEVAPTEPAPEPEPEPEPDRPMSVSDLVEILAEPSPEPEPAGLEPMPAPRVPIPGILTPGRIVHTLIDHDLRAGIVSKVYDADTGECAVFVLEPVAPPRTLRLTYAPEPGHGTWAWPARG